MLGRIGRDLGIFRDARDEHVFTVQAILTGMAYMSYLLAVQYGGGPDNMLAPMPIVFLFGALMYGFGSKRE